MYAVRVCADYAMFAPLDRIVGGMQAAGLSAAN